MGKIPKSVLKFRSRGRRGSIMKPSTFAKIARTSKGGTRAAGAAYWRAARAKARRHSFKDLKR